MLVAYVESNALTYKIIWQASNMMQVLRSATYIVLPLFSHVTQHETNAWWQLRISHECLHAPEVLIHPQLQQTQHPVNHKTSTNSCDEHLQNVRLLFQNSNQSLSHKLSVIYQWKTTESSYYKQIHIPISTSEYNFFNYILDNILDKESNNTQHKL